MREIVIAVVPDGQSLDAIGPFEVFSTARRILEHRGVSSRASYAVSLASIPAGPVRMESGVSLIAGEDLARRRRPIDTLIMAGGIGTRSARKDPRWLRALSRWAPRVRRLGSVCTGALCLAEAGLLNGRRATTHWSACEQLAREYPEVRVEPDAIYLRDGDVWTSAGVTAGMDLALAMVEADHDAALALDVAQQLVMFLKRPGGQSQFSAMLAGQRAGRSSIERVTSYIAEHPEADLSVPSLARRCGMSPRNFARVFQSELGEGPGHYVERVRVEAARRELESSRRSVDEIARSAGFGTSETLRRAFHRRLGVSPQDYRGRFRS